LDPDDWRRALSDVRRLIEAEPGPGERVHRNKPGATVVRRQLQVGPHALDVFIKQHRPRSAVGRLIDLFRSSRAKRAFRQGHRLMMHGLSTALPLACLERRVGPVVVESVLVTEAAAEAVALHRFLAGPFAAMPPRQQAGARRQLAEQIGRAVAVLWRCGLVHRDLKAPNLLVRCEAGRPAELVVIDLDGVRRAGPDRARALRRVAQSADELAGLTRTDRLRVLRAFLGPGQPWKPLWRAAAAARRRQAACHRAAGRDTNNNY
jgi:hypothetical protein